MSEPIVDEQMRAYYHQRAPEYDDWWLGTGLFALRERPAGRPRWTSWSDGEIVHDGDWFAVVAA